jgi:hypothetical protein
VAGWARKRDDVRALVLVGSQARTDTPASAGSAIGLGQHASQVEFGLADPLQRASESEACAGLRFSLLALVWTSAAS